jgi:hypothetical protein
MRAERSCPPPGRHRHAEVKADCEQTELAMDAFFKLVAAGPMFFVSAWLLMIFAGIVSSDVGIRPFGYVTSMVVTIGLWLTLAPAIGAIGRPKTGKNKAKSCSGRS